MAEEEESKKSGGGCCSFICCPCLKFYSAFCEACTCCGRWFGFGGCCSGFNQSDDEWMTHIARSKDRFCTDLPCLFLLMLALVCQLLFVQQAYYENDANSDWLLYGRDWNATTCKPGNAGGAYSALPDLRNTEFIVCVHDCNQTEFDSRFVWNYRSKSLMDSYCIPDFDWVRSIGYAAEGLWDSFADVANSVSEVVNRCISDIIEAKYVILTCGCGALVFSFMYGWFLRRYGATIVWISIFLALAAGCIISYGMIITSEWVRNLGLPMTADFLYYGGVIMAILTCLAFLSVLAIRKQIKLAIALLKQAVRAYGDMELLVFQPLWAFCFCCAYFLFWLVTLVYMLAVWDEFTDRVPGATWNGESPAREEFLCPAPGITIHKNGKTINCLDPVNMDFNLLHCCGSNPFGDKDNCCLSLFETMGHETWQNLDINETMYNLTFVHLFILLWAIQFIIYMGYTIVCGAFAEWYFADWKPNDKNRKDRGPGATQLSKWPIMGSTWRTVRYHMGTCAFGAFIIAIINTIRAILTYIEIQCDTKEQSTLQKILLRCVHCLLNCLQCIFDRVNKNGFIICAVSGLPFCSASFKGLRLIFKNILRVAALTMVSEFLQTIGVVCITGLATCSCILYLMYGMEGEVVSVTFPALTVAILAYIIASLYMLVFQVGIDTTFICFLIDETVNGSKGLRAHAEVRRLFASAQLESFEVLAGKDENSTLIRNAFESEREFAEFKEKRLEKEMSELKLENSKIELSNVNTHDSRHL